MKVLNKTTPYYLKRVLPVLGITVATLLGGCKKDDPDPTPTKDIEIVFSKGDTKTYLYDTVKEVVYSKEAPTIRTIYLVPAEGQWENSLANNIQLLRTNVLQPTLDLSPKVKGKGDLNFRPGQASKIPEDSLWYVKNGWTINKQYQK